MLLPPLATDQIPLESHSESPPIATKLWRRSLLNLDASLAFKYFNTSITVNYSIAHSFQPYKESMKIVLSTLCDVDLSWCFSVFCHILETPLFRDFTCFSTSLLFCFGWRTPISQQILCDSPGRCFLAQAFMCLLVGCKYLKSSSTLRLTETALIQRDATINRSLDEKVPKPSGTW